ncbi:MAG TPA: LutB/LldF family L-lactate oxidation iron-sulfur protein [Catalimonadaceae bacterium]|jgi:L-lactate dehydrogenase complex protein LldF|nr:LutB/LldF family L-lactate oxidation iron-sulfur protein [Catalimonadaceae bacterium]
MELIEKTFLEQAEIKAFDLRHRATLSNNMAKYRGSVKGGMHQYVNHELARSRASFRKQETMARLDKFLMQWEEKFTARGGKVFWASDSKEALRAIDEVINHFQVRLAVKSKSMTSEEIGLNEHLESKGVEPYETDLGEFIVQLAGQKPYHIVTPAMHMRKQDVSELFQKNLGIEYTDSAEELTLAARRVMREKYTEAELGISGGNFLIADIGGIALTENEGNARLSVTFPKVHIAIVGIEKMIPSMADLDLFWPLLSTSGTGQQVTVYNTILTGPRQEDEPDGPEEMVVILLDNGRSKLLADTEKRQALHCIRCGACLNACPVYRSIGGHSYATTYSGPIGSVLSPQFLGLAPYKHLSFASSLCGGCTSVCPVKIDIHQLLLKNRKQSVDEGLSSSWESLGFTFWKKAMLNRRWMNFAGAGIKQWISSRVFKGAWEKRRTEIEFAPKSFNQLWKERKK